MQNKTLTNSIARQIGGDLFLSQGNNYSDLLPDQEPLMSQIET
jgi:hypothetical protein